MKNLAGIDDCDAHILRELTEAGIDPVYHSRRSKGEVAATVTGELGFGSFVFRRAWYYWVVEGNVPIELARKMYAVEERRDVRVSGHCGCPPPDEWAEPSEKELRRRCKAESMDYDFWKDMRMVTLYHIDSQEGLNFFVRAVTGKWNPETPTL